MTPPAVLERSARILLFVLLAVLMVIAGTHLLESVCYTFFGAQEKTSEAIAENGIPFRIRAGGPLGLLHSGYRYLIAAAFLVLGYNGLALKPWTRIWLVRVLLLDLIAWLLHALRYLFVQPPFVLSHEQIFLEIAAVAFEGGLLWLLVQPASVGHFARQEKKSSMAV